MSDIKLFKFGGASIKDADAIRNVAAILKNYSGQKIILVVSALGKTTNALEKIVTAHVQKTGEARKLLTELKQQHIDILKQLIVDTAHPIYNQLENTFVEADWVLDDEPVDQYDYIYDQIVSIGELASTRLVSAYLNHVGVKTEWVDVRSVLLTDNTYREGKVNWEVTEMNINEQILPKLNGQFVLTQGFIGTTTENVTTTLGREGSDYTASILAYSLNTESVTIWKDVPGVLSGDPRYFKDVKKIDALTYHEAIEMTYFGATVIHPKTIKPLQNKNIPLYVRSFVKPTEKGTVIIDNLTNVTYPPILVIKKEQLLVSLSAPDFSFIAEDNMSLIFNLLAKHRIKMNMMQNAAISFSLCTDDPKERTDAFIKEMKDHFTVRTNGGLDLLTIRHYTDEIVNKLTEGKEILLEQKTRHTVQLVLRG